MDTRCPNCSAELKGRYLGAATLRCPACKAVLRQNIHPAEEGPKYAELGFYAVGVLVVGGMSLVGVSEAAVGAAAFAAVIAYGAVILYKSYAKIPANWPRWIKQGERQHKR